MSREKTPKGEMPIEQSGIRLPLELKLELERLAAEKGMPFNSFVLLALRQFVEDQ